MLALTCCGPALTPSNLSTSSSSLSSSNPSTSSSSLSSSSLCSISLLSLPVDVIRRILCYADVLTLANLAQTNTRLRDEIDDDRLWRYQAIRRFRVTPRVTTSRRLSMDSVNWRTLYANWHVQHRMPVSRYSGPTFSAFAKGASDGVVAWFTVTSSEDCRMAQGVLRTRIIVQNVSARDVQVIAANVAVHVRDVGRVSVNNNNDSKQPFCSVSIAKQKPIRFRAIQDNSHYDKHLCTLDSMCVQEEQLNYNNNNEAAEYDGNTCTELAGLINNVNSSCNRTIMSHDILRKDDFVIVFVDVKITGPNFEIEALERLEKIIVPIVADGTTIPIVCKMSDRTIWDAYELLPGGWWARAG